MLHIMMFLKKIWMNEVEKPKWLAHPNNLTLANQQGIQRYINYLEEEVKTLSQNLEESKRMIIDYKLRLNTKAYSLQQELEEVKK